MSELPREQRPPAYRVLRLPAWRRELADPAAGAATKSAGRVLVEDRETGIEQSWNLWTAEILEGLAREEPYAALVDRIQALWPERPREWCDATVRRFFYTLHRIHAIELLFDAPSSFHGGRYEVRKELGRGGVGVAWLCRDTKTARDVVVKRAWDYFAPLAKTDALVRAEADVMLKLDHPRIAKAYDVFDEGGLHHLVREFAPGKELSHWRGQGIVDVATRRLVGREIAGLVGHLHERGFLLLDLRPANFFLDPDTMAPRLIDVGHCKPMQDGLVELGIPRPGRAHGSPGFAAPETTTDGRATPRTDVWGFGRLYSFMIGGALPKHGMTTSDLLVRLADAPEGEREVVARCADDRVDARPGSMRDVASLLA